MQQLCIYIYIIKLFKIVGSLLTLLISSISHCMITGWPLDFLSVGFLASCSQAVAAISDIRKDIPIHLELASMTDKDYMNSIMQEVHVDNQFSEAVC